MCAVIDQFSGPYSTVHCKACYTFRLQLFPKCFMSYHQMFLTFRASKHLELSFTPNCYENVLKTLQQFQIDSFKCRVHYWNGLGVDLSYGTMALWQELYTNCDMITVS